MEGAAGVGAADGDDALSQVDVAPLERQPLLRPESGAAAKIAIEPNLGPSSTATDVVPLALEVKRSYRDDELATRCRACNSRKRV